MKKLLALVCVAALSLSVFAGCGSDTEESKESAANTTTEESSAAEVTTTEKTVFTVGFDAEFPPYGYRDENGEYVGFDLDLAQEVCNRMGWELVKQPIDWDAKDMELSSGSISCIWNGFTMNGREDQYTWTTPYVDNSQVFAVAADNGISSKADLAGKIVAVQKDSSALAALNDEESPENIELRDSFSQLIEYADYNTAFMDLEMGAVDAVAIDIGVAKYQVEQREAGAFVILADTLATEQYGVGFKLGNTQLRDQVQTVIDEMAADGTFANIAAKWDLTDSICIGK